MRKFGKIAAAAIAATTAMALASACSGGDSTNDSGGETRTVKIGFIGSLTGPAASLQGTPQLNGLKAGIAYLQAEGAIPEGITYEIVERDAATDASLASAAARELARDRDIIAIVAGGGTEQTQAMQQPLAQAKIPTFTANEGKEFLAEIGEGKTYPWIFATSADPSLGVDPAIDAMVEQGVTKLGVLYPDYAYGQTMAALAEAAAKRLNIEVMVKSAAANAASYSAQLQELKAWGAQGLAISIFGAQAATAMSELQQIDWAPIVTGPLGIIDQAVIESMSPEGAQKAIASPVPQGFLGTGPLEGVVKGFYDHYSTIASTNVIDGRTFVGTYGFDAMLLINAALTANPKATGEDLKAWLDEGHEVTASRGTYSFGPQKRTNVLGDQYGIIVVGVPCGGGTKCAEYGG